MKHFEVNKVLVSFEFSFVSKKLYFPGQLTKHRGNDRKTWQTIDKACKINHIKLLRTLYHKENMANAFNDYSLTSIPIITIILIVPNVIAILYISYPSTSNFSTFKCNGIIEGFGKKGYFESSPTPTDLSSLSFLFKYIPCGTFFQDTRIAEQIVERIWRYY